MSESKFFALLIGAAVLHFVVGAGLIHLRRGPVDFARIVVAVLIVVAVAFASVLVLSKVGFNLFGVIHLAWLDIAVVVPALGILTVIRRVKSRDSVTRSAFIAALLSLGIIPFAIAATFVEPFRLQLETAELGVARERAGSMPLRIGILADIQTNAVGAHERAAVDMLMKEKPDVIIVPGDLFHGWASEREIAAPKLRRLLGRLDAPGGVWFVKGDVDQGPKLKELLGGTKLRLLHNRSERIKVRDRIVTIGGIELMYRSGYASNAVERMASEPGDDDVRILVSHRPGVVMDMGKASRIDLVIAGHTHGGQVVVPGYGPPITLSAVPRNVAAGGLHRIRGNAIYVSRGVGCERGQAPRMRLFCPPEVTILTLK